MSPKAYHKLKGALKKQKKGALHRMLHIPEGQKVPENVLRKAMHSTNPLERKRADLANTEEHFNHGGKKRKRR